MNNDRNQNGQFIGHNEEGNQTSTLLGNSPAIAEAREFILKVASVESPVLLLGPSGSGKEVVAKEIHAKGERGLKPFVAINCASLSEQLMEAELFGYEKGAFTGAVSSQPGKFELAKGGTLFLDEIGELSPAIQAKFLRVLQDGKFFRVGGLKEIETDVRIIAATHRPLRDMVSAGSFREDLFFRLNVLSCSLPPLSERGEDVRLLVEHFWAKFSREYNKTLSLSAEAMELLCHYSYPGNVRELCNVLEGLMVLTTGTNEVAASLLPREFQVEKSPLPTTQLQERRGEYKGKSLNESVEILESRLVSYAMKKFGENQVKAAKFLKVSRGALQYKLKKYGYRLPERQYGLGAPQSNGTETGIVVPLAVSSARRE